MYTYNYTKYKYLYFKMEAFINVIEKDPFVCMKINIMLDKLNRFTYDRNIELVYDNLIQNIILKELIKNIVNNDIRFRYGIKNEN